MREDLAEWLNTMYPELEINVENFMDRLDTGVALCKVGLCTQFHSILVIFGLNMKFYIDFIKQFLTAVIQVYDIVALESKIVDYELKYVEFDLLQS